MLKEFGKHNFENKILTWCFDQQELDEMEKFYIQKYQKQNPEKCYNLAHGGIGGNVWMYSSQNEKDDFVTKMTEINRHRCSTNSFKQNQKNNMIKRYSNEEERKKTIR